MTFVKICGIRDAENALIATEAGADYLGFVFVEGVRRQLELDQAKTIINDYRSRLKDRRPKIVGLFANQSVEFVNLVIAECELDLVQICGDEDAEFLAKVDVPIFRQVRVREGSGVEQVVANVERQVRPLIADGHMALLDKHQEGELGGTGVTFDWSIAARIAVEFDFLLAGGLSPDNVAEAISVVKPWAVDVSTGVETDGVKDADKIRDFVRIAKSAT